MKDPFETFKTIRETSLDKGNTTHRPGSTSELGAFGGVGLSVCASAAQPRPPFLPQAVDCPAAAKYDRTIDCKGWRTPWSGRVGATSRSSSVSARYSALENGIAAAGDDDDDDEDPRAVAEEGEEQGAGRATELVPLETSTSNKTETDSVVVIAPANLSGGCGLHCFDAHGRSVLVRVPPEGVFQGQRFVADVVLRLGNDDSDDDDAEADRDGYHHRIPTGRWRDGLCHCFAHGICHPTLWLGWGLVLGQVMTRVGLDATGNAVHPRGGPRASACRVVAVIGILFVSVDCALTVASLPRPTKIFVHALCRALVGIYLLVVLIRTRAHVRQQHGIPEHYCTGGLEDFCCSCWLPCCTTLQIARHTADYNRYSASVFSETGLRPRPRHPPDADV